MATVTGWPRDGYPFHADELADTFAGMIRRDSAGLPVPGVLGDVSVSAVASSWQVRVDPFIFVSRVGTGVRLSGESAAEHVDITPAAGNIPAGQARIDVVAWDTDNAELVVVEGTPAVSPSVPSAGGAEPLAEVRVNAGDGQVIASQVTKVFARTGLATGGQVAQGTVSKRSVSSNAHAVVDVVFPTGRFSAAPNVQVTAVSTNRHVSAHVDDVTATGCRVRLVNMDPASRSVGAMWRAEQI